MDINKEIEILEKKARLKLTFEEKVRFKKELIEFKEGLKLFDELDLSKVVESITPFSVRGSVLRNDDEIENNSFNILKNASKTKKGYIILDKDGEE